MSAFSAIVPDSFFLGFAATRCLVLSDVRLFVARTVELTRSARSVAHAARDVLRTDEARAQPNANAPRSSRRSANPRAARARLAPRSRADARDPRSRPRARTARAASGGRRLAPRASPSRWRVIERSGVPAASSRSTYGRNRSSTRSSVSGSRPPNSARVELRDEPRILIRGAPEHHAVDVRRARARTCRASVSPPLITIRERGELALQPMHARIVERRNLAILLRAQAVQPRLARVHDERVAAGRRDGRDEAAHELVGIVVVDAEPRLHRHGHRNGAAHRGDAVRDSARIEHQRRAEASRPELGRWGSRR